MREHKVLRDQTYKHIDERYNIMHENITISE